MRSKYPGDLAAHVHAELKARGGRPPREAVLAELFEVMYFASLTHEESEAISCRIAFIPRDTPDANPPKRIVADRWQYFALPNDIPFSVSNVTKLSKAADPWGSTLAVDVDSEDNLKIWGLIDQSVHYSTFVMKEASVGPEMPGIFQAVIQGIGEIAVYKTYILLGGLRHGDLLGRQSRVFEDGPVRQRLGKAVTIYQQSVAERVGKPAYEFREHWPVSLEDQWVSSLCRILIGIKRYGHGGAVLISDETEGLKPKYPLRYPRLAEALISLGAATIKSTNLRDEIWTKYAKTNSYEMPTKLHLDQSRVDAELENTTNEVTGCICFLTSLSRVDGLIWLDSPLHLSGFGVEIKVAEDPEKVVKAENTAATKTTALSPDHFGMRHRSMMRYCGMNAKSIGFVVSQHGDVRAIMKLGKRVVLWDNVRLQRIIMPRSSKPGRPKPRH